MLNLNIKTLNVVNYEKKKKKYNCIFRNLWLLDVICFVFIYKDTARHKSVGINKFYYWHKKKWNEKKEEHSHTLDKTQN